MAAGCHHNQLSELKLLRKPLPCKKETAFSFLNKCKAVKEKVVKEKNLESTNKGKEESYRREPVKVDADLNGPDWIFLKPRGPDSFPLRTSRKQYPLNKRKVFADTRFFQDRDNQLWDWNPRHSSQRGVRVIEFCPLPANENCWEDQNVLPDLNGHSRAADLNALVKLDQGEGVTNKEREVHVSVLELELPSNVNFRMKRPALQVLVEEKASQLKEMPFCDDLNLASGLKDWTTQLEPTFPYNPKYMKHGYIGAKECRSQEKVPALLKRMKARQHSKQAFDGDYHAFSFSDSVEESNKFMEGYEKMIDVTADIPTNTTTTRIDQDCDHKVRRRSTWCTFADLAEEAAFQCSTEGGVYLSLKVHNVDSLPDLSFLYHTLVYLNLSFNNFTKIPEEIFAAKQLEVLKLRNNPIRTISNRIKKLKNLRVLGLSFCRISEFSPGILQLCSLEHLDLSYNELSSLPNETEGLRNLKELNVAGNQLWALPKGILSLNLKSLNCTSNFLHPLLWRENGGPQPQKLADICVTYIAHDDEFKSKLPIPEPVASLFTGLSSCDFCSKAKVGQGVKLIKPVVELFGNINIPIVFYVCSQKCRDQLKKVTSVAAPLDVENGGG